MGRSCNCCASATCKRCNCIDVNRFNNYEWGILICNINSAKDNEFDLYIDNVKMGSLKELGLNRCQGKYFVTNQSIIPKIKQSKTCFKPNGYLPDRQCCVTNTTAFTVVEKSVFSKCGKIQIIMRPTKNNRNGNYGTLDLFRVIGSDICVVDSSIYAESDFKDITVILNQICCK